MENSIYLLLGYGIDLFTTGPFLFKFKKYYSFPVPLKALEAFLTFIKFNTLKEDWKE